MKKLIMFVMVFCIAGSALGVLEDIPPTWGNVGTVTAVWDFATEPEYMNEFEGVTNTPFCNDPELGTYMMPISFEGEPLVWEDGAIHSTLGGFWFSVGIPEGGDYVTMRVQMHLTSEEGPGVAEPQAQDCVSTAVDECNIEEEAEETEDLEWVGNVMIYQWTWDRGDIVAVGGFVGLDNVEGCTGLIVDAIVHDTEEPPSIFPRTSACFIKPILIVDSNDIPVYEPQDMGPPVGPPVYGPTEGQLLVSLNYKPGDPTYPAFTATVVVDPNEGPGPHADFIFSDSVAADGSVTLTFTEANWSDPQPVAVQAIQDLDREGNQSYPVELTVTIDIADPNFANKTASASVGVVDNDVPYVSALPDEIELSENTPGTCVDLNLRLSHKPTDDVYVRVYAEGLPFGDDDKAEMASIDPTLDPEGLDPNILTFTVTDDEAWVPATMTSGWNREQTITVCPIDNDELAEAWLEDVDGQMFLPSYSEDVRYLVPWLNPDGSNADDPCTPDEEEESDGEADETIVVVIVQDNECGAIGYDQLDFNEDCRVGLADFANFYAQWLICTEPYDGADEDPVIPSECVKLWNLVVE